MKIPNVSYIKKKWLILTTIICHKCSDTIETLIKEEGRKCKPVKDIPINVKWYSQVSCTYNKTFFSSLCSM